MRIRQVKPAFWSDPRLAELPEATRLFYIGLWMIADDAGWLRVDVAEIGRDLYGYEDRAPREARVAVMLAELVEHQRDCVPVSPRTSADIPGSPPRNGNRNVDVIGTERNGTYRKGSGSASARALEGAALSPFAESMAAAGYKPGADA